MTQLTTAQRILLTKAIQHPEVCISRHMQHMPRHIAQNMLDKLQQHGYVTVQHNDNKIEYFITEAGMRYNAIEMPPETNHVPQPCNHSQNKQKPSTAKIKRTEENSKSTKQNIMRQMLQAGTTIEALMQSTGWQKHTVHGAISNLKRQQGMVIERLTQDNQPTIYRIVD